jgi:GT2 family glycosyltransferase
MAARGFNIVVPYHGQYTALRECIGSIFLQTRHLPFKITVVDDGSPNKDFFSTIAQIDNQIDGIRLDEQRGMGAALNEAIKSTEEPWLVFLNSDCVIRELDWLTNLYQALETNMKNKVGLVSACMNNGGNCTAIERDRTAPRNQNCVVSNEPLPLICTIAPRKLFDRVGLFQEYPYGYYEDEEFFWRMKKKGYQQAYCEKSWVEHKGGLTVQALWESNPNIKNIMLEDNRKKCLHDCGKIVIN